ncbi:hypothetical protein FQZ97_860960 [compost metagenome]
MQSGFEGLAAVQVVFGLDALVARQAVPFAGDQGFGQPHGGVVGGADGAHLARLHVLGVCGQGVGQRCVGIVLVRLVQVHVVRLQAGERCFQGAANVGRRQPLGVGPHFHADLGGDEHAVALARTLEPFADQRLGFPALVAFDPSGIHIGRVDEIQARIHHGVQQGVRAGLVHGPAEDVATEGERRNLQAGTAQCAFDHGEASGSGGGLQDGRRTVCTITGIPPKSFWVTAS